MRTLKPYRVPLFSIMETFESVVSLFLFEIEPGAAEKRLLANSPINYKAFWSIRIPLPFSGGKRFPRFIPLDYFFKVFKFKPHIIVCPEYNLQTILAYIYAALFRCKVIIWCSLTKNDERLSFHGQNALRNILRRNADAFVCYSGEAIEYLKSSSVPEEKCFLVENCSDVSYFMDRYRRDNNYRDGRPARLLYVGALIREKGLWDLFESVENLTNLNWLLTVVGEGYLAKELETFSERRLNGRVGFLGALIRENLPAVYNQADIFIFPSHSDVWGHVVDEAMASGCCVLASDQTVAAMELIEDGLNGMIFKTGCVKTLTEKLRQLIQNPTLCRVLGEKAHKTMEEHNESISASGIRRAIAYVSQGRR